MPAVMAKLLVGAAVLASNCAEAARIKQRQPSDSDVDTKVLAGVPVVNYNLRFVQDEGKKSAGTAAELDWVVVFKDGATEKDILTFCGGAELEGACRVIGHADGGFPFATTLVSEQKLEKMLMSRSSMVSYVEPDLPVYVLPDIPEVASVTPDSNLWGHDTIKLSQNSYTGAGVHVYVMDTGVRVSHRDFGGRAIPTLDTIAGNGRAVECNGDANCAADENGHGTHCAGTAAGTQYGAATQATIHAMKVCCGAGSNLLSGMDWIGVKGQRPAVMTMSLGSWGSSSAQKRAVDLLVNGGVTVFVSAGNNNDDACLKTFPVIPSAIAVGSTTSTNTRSSFSNFGSCVSIWAPGSQIYSASHRSDTQGRYLSGTSMATPLAAGVGALLVQEFPNYSPVQIRAVMVRRSQRGLLSDLKPNDVNYLLSA